MHVRVAVMIAKPVEVNLVILCIDTYCIVLYCIALYCMSIVLYCIVCPHVCLHYRGAAVGMLTMYFIRLFCYLL